MKYQATFKPVDHATRPTWHYTRRLFDAESDLAAQVRAQHIAREEVLYLVQVEPTSTLDPAYVKAYCS